MDESVGEAGLNTAGDSAAKRWILTVVVKTDETNRKWKTKYPQGYTPSQ